MDSPALSALLGGTWFGDGLRAGTRARLAALGSLVTIPEGTVVVHEGMPCRAMGVLVSGRIALRLVMPGGPDRTILTVEAGDVYGWSTVMPPSISTSTGVAVSPSEAILFEGDALRSVLAVDCELAAAVYYRLLASVARRLTATRLQLLDVYGPGSEPW